MYKTPGFIPDIEKKEDYLFGSLGMPREVLNESGDWRDFEPPMELQRKRFDSYSCVSFANNNAVEAIHKKRYGEEINFSDRFLSVISGTVPGKGNSHNIVAEAKRKKGIVLEEFYPFGEELTQDEFFIYPPKGLLERGLKWTVEAEYNYERVRREDFATALKYSPIQVAVDSRTNRTSEFQGLDHSVLLTYLDKTAWIFDSYLGRFREYDLSYPFSFGMRFHYRLKIILNINDMKFKLIRSIETGKIYLVDSDNKIHHVELEPDFKEIFGLKAWELKDWIDTPESEINKYNEGVSLSSKKVDFINSLKILFNNFGRKADVK